MTAAPGPGGATAVAPRDRPPRWPWLVPPALAALVCAPLLAGRGFALAGDMVFVPFQHWKPAWYGGDGGIPRAVPSDALTSLATHLVPGDLVQKATLLLLLSAAGWGVLHLLRGRPVEVTVPAAVLFVWNPFVHERLGIGHWALLCGYAALPWVVAAARDLGAGRPRALAALVVPVGVAAWTSPTGGVLAAVLAVAVTLACGGRVARTLAAATAALVLNLAWLVPGVLNTPGVAPDASGATAFAARADTAYGLVGSLATLGGIWKASIVPGERGVLLVSTLAVLLTLVAVAGLAVRLAVRGPDRAWLLGLLGPAVVLAVGAAWLSSDLGRPVAEWVVTAVPGGGLVRDAQKWVAPWALVLAVGFGEAVGALRFVSASTGRPTLNGGGRIGGEPADRGGRAGTAWAAAGLVPLLLLPSLAWGLAGFWSPAHYPGEWTRVADRLSSAGAADDRGLVLPFSVYRRFAWAHQRAVLDPAPRFFPGQWLTDDALGVGEGRVVGGDAAEPARVRAALAEGTLPATLRELGIRWVLVEKGTPGRVPPVPGATVAHDGPQLRLLDLGSGRPADRSRAATGLLVALAAVGVLWWACVARIGLGAVRSLYAGGRTD